MQRSVGEHTFDYQTVRELSAVRCDPRADAEQVTQVLPGEPLTVRERREGWARIETAYAYPGWIDAAALGGDPDPSWADARVADPLDHARALLGSPYQWGGMTGGGIDCSGLIHMSFRAVGTVVPRDADQQELAGEEIDETELRSGDLISYGDAERADHVAFWVGDGRILHSTQRDGVDGVVEEEEPAYLRARRRHCFRF
jgi:gamma-D-glutamyl-L-lysine dipeptidyl-peptidase